MDNLALVFSMTLFPLMAMADVSLNQIFPCAFGKPLDGWQNSSCLPQYFLQTDHSVRLFINSSTEKSELKITRLHRAMRAPLHCNI